MKNDVPPLSGDELVFLPSGKDYPRSPQVVPGQRHDPKFDFVSITYRDVAEAAQIYADFSGREVRVPKSLADRPLRLGQGQGGMLPGNTAFGYVIWSLDWQLPSQGIDVVTLGSEVVAFRPGQSPRDPVQRLVATEAEMARYAASLDENRFWQLIADATRRGGRDCDRVADALQSALSRLSEDEILGFELHYHELMNRSYRWDLWAVAYIVNGGASDDGFTYFRAWLIGQGRERFEAALTHPPDAVRGLSADAAGFAGFECEDMLYPAMQAYQAKTGRLPPMMPLAYPTEPAGTPWTEEDLPRLYPELFERMR